MTNQQNVMFEAALAGENWARGLKKGMRFEGARPEAERRYRFDTKAQRLFVDAALGILEKGRVVTDMAGILVEDVIREVR